MKSQKKLGALLLTSGVLLVSTTLPLFDAESAAPTNENTRSDVSVSISNTASSNTSVMGDFEAVAPSDTTQGTDDTAEPPKDISGTPAESVPGENPSSTDDESAEKPTDESAEKPTDESAEKPTDESAEKPTDESTEKPTDESTEKPTDESAEKPTDESTEKPTDESTEKPTDESTEKPTDESTEKPTDESTEKPDEKPSEESPAIEKAPETLNATNVKGVATVTLTTANTSTIVGDAQLNENFTVNPTILTEALSKGLSLNDTKTAFEPQLSINLASIVKAKDATPKVSTKAVTGSYIYNIEETSIDSTVAKASITGDTLTINDIQSLSDLAFKVSYYDKTTSEKLGTVSVEIAKTAIQNSAYVGASQNKVATYDMTASDSTIDLFNVLKENAKFDGYTKADFTFAISKSDEVKALTDLKIQDNLLAYKLAPGTTKEEKIELSVTNKKTNLTEKLVLQLKGTNSSLSVDKNVTLSPFTVIPNLTYSEFKLPEKYITFAGNQQEQVTLSAVNELGKVIEVTYNVATNTITARNSDDLKASSKIDFTLKDKAENEVKFSTTVKQAAPKLMNDTATDKERTVKIVISGDTSKATNINMEKYYNTNVTDSHKTDYAYTATGTKGAVTFSQDYKTLVLSSLLDTETVKIASTKGISDTLNLLFSKNPQEAVYSTLTDKDFTLNTTLNVTPYLPKPDSKLVDAFGEHIKYVNGAVQITSTAKGTAGTITLVFENGKDSYEHVILKYKVPTALTLTNSNLTSGGTIALDKNTQTYAINTASILYGDDASAIRSITYAVDNPDIAQVKVETNAITGDRAVITAIGEGKTSLKATVTYKDGTSEVVASDIVVSKLTDDIPDEPLPDGVDVVEPPAIDTPDYDTPDYDTPDFDTPDTTDNSPIYPDDDSSKETDDAKDDTSSKDDSSVDIDDSKKVNDSDSKGKTVVNDNGTDKATDNGTVDNAKDVVVKSTVQPTPTERVVNDAATKPATLPQTSGDTDKAAGLLGGILTLLGGLLFFRKRKDKNENK